MVNVRPPKISNVRELIKQKAEAGEMIVLPHAISRQALRLITVADIVYVLVHGWHEKKKDKYVPEYLAWNYAIRGNTVDKRELRIVVSFDENGMLVITVIDLGRTI